jgi:hypothetical protein
MMSGDEQKTGIKHRIIWGIIMTAVIGVLLIAGSSVVQVDQFSALQDATRMGALLPAFFHGPDDDLTCKSSLSREVNSF